MFETPVVHGRPEIIMTPPVVAPPVVAPVMQPVMAPMVTMPPKPSKPAAGKPAAQKPPTTATKDKTSDGLIKPGGHKPSTAETKDKRRENASRPHPGPEHRFADSFQGKGGAPSTKHPQPSGYNIKPNNDSRGLDT